MRHFPWCLDSTNQIRRLPVPQPSTPLTTAGQINQSANMSATERLPS
uniref:Uncharacterized protein n=1 Tax=Arundo donax TaxID=35708 RepID=A0A0A8ZIR0_ARUDO